MTIEFDFSHDIERWGVRIYWIVTVVTSNVGVSSTRLVYSSPWARGVVGTILGVKFPHTFSESSVLVFYEKVWGPCQQSSLVSEIASSW